MMRTHRMIYRTSSTPNVFCFGGIQIQQIASRWHHIITNIRTAKLFNSQAPPEIFQVPRGVLIPPFEKHLSRGISNISSVAYVIVMVMFMIMSRIMIVIIVLLVQS